MTSVHSRELVLTSTFIGIVPGRTLSAVNVLLPGEYFSHAGRPLPSIPLTFNISPPAASTTLAGIGKLKGLPADRIFTGTVTVIAPGRSASACRTSATVISSAESSVAPALPVAAPPLLANE